MSPLPTSNHFRRALGILRRSLWIIGLVAVVLLVAWFRLWSPVRVQVVRIDRGAITQEAFGRGTIESQREAAVGFDLVGRLSDVLVDEGTRVTLGQEIHVCISLCCTAEVGIAAVRWPLSTNPTLHGSSTMRAA